jgi:hypothetical protein
MKLVAPQLLKKTVVALVVVLLAFSKQIGSFLNLENRFYFLWRFNDGLALLLDVALLAAVAVFISELLRRLKWDRVRRVYNHIFLLALICGVLSHLPGDVLRPRPDSGWYFLTWMTVAAVLGFSLGYPRSRLVEYGAQLCLIFSPLVLILSFQVLTLKSWDAGQEPEPNYQALRQQAQSAGATQPPVFFFVFDEWSFKHSYRDGELLPSLPHMRELSAQSFDFREAWSHSNQTKYSLPAIVFQTDRGSQIDGGQMYWKDPDSGPLPSEELPSMFRAAKDRGYWTAMLGFYLPYRKMLGSQLDYCRVWSGYPKGKNLAEDMLVGAARNLQYYLTDPVTEAKRQSLQARIESRWWFDMNNALLEASLGLIKECPRNTFAFFHWPLPHGPFVFEPDGSYYGPYKGRGGKFPGLHGSTEDYERSLLYLDRVIGRIVEQLKEAEQYDNALLVFTADHGWRSDMTEDFSIDWKVNPVFRRVPLFIKLPNQKAGHLVETNVYNNRLEPILDLAFQGELTEKRMISLIEQLQAAPPTLERPGQTAVSQ